MPDADGLLTPQDVRRLLDEHGLAPRKAAGQNFVSDPNTVRRIVEAAEVAADDVVVEIGPGLGSLTLGLARAVRHVVAIELDHGLADLLEAEAPDNVTVVRADAMDVDLTAAVQAAGAEQGVIVANLPYNVATPLVMHGLAHGPAVSRQFVMVQREVGERWAARPGDRTYGAVSAKVALRADARIAFTVSRQVFHPVPNVDSVMVDVRNRDGVTIDPRVLAVIDLAFGRRRKTLRNNLKALVADGGPDDDRLDRAFGAAGVDPGARAETLEPAVFVALTEALLESGIPVESGRHGGRP